MLMKKTVIFLIVSSTITSCIQRPSQLPVNVSNLIPVEHISLNNSHSFGYLNNEKKAGSINSNLTHNILENKLLSAKIELDMYKNLGDKNVFIQVQNAWEKIKTEWDVPLVQGTILNDSIIKEWFEFNLNLLLLTGECKYADEIEKMIGFQLSSSEDASRMITKTIYTKMYDQLYVNLFVDSEIQFEHTTGGLIKLKQKVNYSGTNKIEIEFENELKRYMELFIRIPSDIESARVVVGGVKYKAVQGEYCRIAKKWKTGNKVEVYFEK